MSSWRLQEGESDLRLAPVVQRSLGSEEFTWADLLYSRLNRVQVFVLYFPSRFDLPTDATAKTSLRAFGQQSGPGSSINFWDPTDPEFSQALRIFDVAAPPALILASGAKDAGASGAPIDPADLYVISITDPQILDHPTRLAAAVNNAHEVLMRADAKEIAGFVRQQAANSLVATIGRVAANIRDEFVKCKPKFQLPGGISVQLG